MRTEERNVQRARSSQPRLVRLTMALRSLVRRCLYSESQLPAMPDHRSASRLRAPFAVSVYRRRTAKLSLLAPAQRLQIPIINACYCGQRCYPSKGCACVRPPGRHRIVDARHRALLLRFRPTFHRRETAHAPLAVPPSLYRHRPNSLMPAHFIRVQYRFRTRELFDPRRLGAGRPSPFKLVGISSRHCCPAWHLLILT